MTAYYNEFDPFAAAWLRELIKAGHIAPGEVDERSILDVTSNDLRGFTQHHFFAGIGTWSHALRSAGWSDDRPVWTGSPPCQPFSVAGKGRGKEDERHLAPHWLDLVKEFRPASVIGEQVAAAIRHEWLDDLQDALERESYATAAVVLPGCSIGSPHIRQRIWFFAQGLGDTSEKGLQDSEPEAVEREGWREKGRAVTESSCTPGRLAYSGHDECSGRNPIRDPGGEHEEAKGEGQSAGTERIRPVDDAAVCFTGNGVAETESERRKRVEKTTKQAGRGVTEDSSAVYRPNTPDSFWRDADWLYCRDDKWRPVEPGTFPLVDGSTNRVGRLRGYGNGIIAPLAQTFIETCMESIDDICNSTETL